MKKQFKKRLSLLMVLVMVFATMPVFASAQSNDLTGHWAGSVITEWMNKGLVKGYPDGSFKPEATMSRAEFMAIVNKVYNFTLEKDISFTDVKSNDWFYSVVKNAVAAGYISGYPDGRMLPNQPIQRQEVAAIFCKLESLNEDVTLGGQFKDLASSNWAIGYIGAAVKAGYFSGYGDGTFKATMGIKRAEAVVATNKLDSSRALAYGVAGTFGPATGTEVIDKNVVVKADGVILQNLVINGNLTIDEKVGQGTVTLNNLVVKGETFIKGGGPDSIKINGGTFAKVFMMKKSSSPIRILSVGVKNLNIEVSPISQGGQLIFEGVFNSIIISALSMKIVTQGTTTIAEFTINESALNTTVALSQGTTIDLARVKSIAKFTGQGRIITAEVTGTGTVFENPPGKVSTVVPGSTPPATTPTGGGYGGGSYSSPKSDSTETTTPKTVITDMTAIIGMPLVGSPLTAGTVSPALATVSYQWKICTTSDGAYANIDGATSNTYTPVIGDLTKFIKVEITGSGNYTGTLTSSATTTAVTATPTVTTASELSTALSATGVTLITLGGDITGNVTATRTGTTNVVIDFNNKVLTGNLTFTASGITVITLDGNATNSIVGNLTISAGSATMNNNIDVNGTVNIQAISSNTWNQNGNATGITITANGGAFYFMAGTITDGISIDPIANTNPFILEGNLSTLVIEIIAPVMLEIAADATLPTAPITIASTAGGTAIENFSSTPIKITALAPTTIGGSMTDVGSTAVITERQVRPTFSPAEGAIAFGTTVTIISAGADHIYYTTDGTTPTTASTDQAITPLVINAAGTIKALAVKAGKDNSTIGTAVYTQAVATAPTSAVLAVGSTHPVGGITQVVMPAAGATDATGAVTGWVAGSADTIKFTVTASGAAVSAITIGGAAYTSGTDYTIASAGAISIVVTTTETGKITTVRTFTVTVTALAPTMAWSGTTFTESATSAGAITTVLSLTLSNETFVVSGAAMTLGTHYTVTNVPVGLTAVISGTSVTTATVVLTGTAAAHATADSTNMGITFLNAAFGGNSAASVNGSGKELAVTFHGPGMAWSGTAFTESVTTGGAITTVVTLTLTDETFVVSGAAMTAGVEYSVTNVPAGLTAVVTGTSATTATIELTGTAAAHAASDSSAATWGIIFLDAAFTGNVAADVSTYGKSDLAITFQD